MIGRLPTAVMYHYVRDAATRPPVGYRGLEPAAFDAQLDAICRVATPVGWPDLAAALAGRRGLPRDAVVLTFDDGLIDHQRIVLPRLAARGIPAIFFVLARNPREGLTLGHRMHVLLAVLTPTALRAAIVDRLGSADRQRYRALEAGMRAFGPSDPDDVWKRPLQRELADVVDPILADLVAATLGPEDELARELYLQDAQLAELRAAGMTVGGHGHDHRWLDRGDRAGITRELARSAVMLASREDAPWPYAYAYGGVPHGAAAMLRSYGFGAAFTTRFGRSPDRFHIGRIDADELEGRPIDAWLRGRG